MRARRTIKDSNSKDIIFVALFALAIGLIFLAVGLFMGLKNGNEADGRIYTTATIVDVQSDFQYSGSTSHFTCITYVEYEIDGETITARLNPSSSTDQIGDTVDVYYYLDNPTLVEVKGGSPEFAIVFSILGGIGIAFGLYLSFILIKARKIKKQSDNNTAVQSFDGYDNNIDID